MKIGLVNPDCAYKTDAFNEDFFFVNGICYIEAALREAGHEVRIANFAHDKNASLDEIADCPIVGIPSLMTCYETFSRLLPELKEQGKTIICGGPLISSYDLNADNLLMRTFPEIDFGVIGEGELTTPRLISFLEGKAKEIPSGILFRENGEIKTTGNAEIVHNLDDLPRIDYSKWNGFAKLVENHVTDIQLSRGCPYGACSFCYRLAKGAVRSFSLPRIEEEIAKIAALKPRRVEFEDESFLSDKERAIKIGTIAGKYGLKYMIMARINDADLDSLRVLKDTGCEQVGYGIESFDDTVLKEANKGITREQIYRAVELTKKAGIKIIKGFLIVGLQGENKKSLEATIRGVKDLQIISPRVRLMIPLPGTKIYRQALNEGKIDELELFKQFSQHYDTTEGNWVPVNMGDGLSDQELLDARDEIKKIAKNRK